MIRANNEEQDGYCLGRYEFACRYVEGARVLDLATGPGYGAEMMADLGKAGFVLGVDRSEELIRSARTEHDRPCIEFVVGDGLDLGFKDESFDAVVSIETIEHVSDCERFLDELVRLLRRDGILVISTPNGSYDSRNELHLQRFSIDRFRSLLTARFETVEMYGQGPMKRAVRAFARANSIISGRAPGFLMGGLYKLKKSIAPVGKPEIIRSDEPVDCRYQMAVCCGKKHDTAATGGTE